MTKKLKTLPLAGDKRKHTSPSSTTGKKRVLSGVTLHDAAKYVSEKDLIFFERVKKTLKSDAVYHNFLRCLALYNNEIVSRNELANLVSPFIGKSPELLQDLHKILGLESPEAKAETRIAPTTQPTQIQIVPARPEPPIQPKVETGESGSITQPTIPKARVLKKRLFAYNFVSISRENFRVSRKFFFLLQF